MTFGSRQRYRDRPSPPEAHDEPGSGAVGGVREPQPSGSHTPAESAALVISRALGADRAPEPRAPRRPPRAAALAALLVVAGAGGYIAGDSDSAPAKRHTVEAGVVRLDLPEGWRRRPPDAGIERISARPLVASPPGGGGRIVAAELPRRGLGLLPAPAAARLERVSPGDLVMLGALRATRYRAVEADAPRRRVTLFASPTTRGVALVACAVGSGAPGGSFARRCERVAATVALAGARLSSALVPEDVARVARSITVLDARRIAAGRRLRRARSRASRVHVVRTLALAHAGAASAIGRLPDESEAARAGAPVIRALRGVEGAYRELASASLRAGRSREQAARRSVRRRDALLRRVVARL